MLTQISPPQVEPVSLQDARTYLRVDSDFTGEDMLISGLIRAARVFAEAYTGRSFITQQWQLTLDDFPGPSLTGMPYGRTYGIPPHAITLERGTVQSIDSIQYLNAGAWSTLTQGTDFITDLSGNPARITPPFGRIWPVISTPQIGNVKVAYTAGYGDTAATVPDGIKNWMLIRVGTLFTNREAVAILARGKVEPLPYVDELLNPYVVVRY